MWLLFDCCVVCKKERTVNNFEWKLQLKRFAQIVVGFTVDAVLVFDELLHAILHALENITDVKESKRV